MSAPKVYLAGPDVFRPNAKAIGRRRVELCRHHGLEGLWPADGAGADACGIFLHNLELIDQADALIADIAPFRGPHMDVGTAFEISRGYAQGKLTFAYVRPAHPAHLIDRIPWFDGPDGKIDREGNLIEDFGLIENLMIACAVCTPVDTSVEMAIRRCARWLKDGEA